MKIIIGFIMAALATAPIVAQDLSGSPADIASLNQATLAIREAFAAGDFELVGKLHHPDIVKYFGGANVVRGRAELVKGLSEWFRTTKVEFVENTVESTAFAGDTAIQTCIFAIKSTPKSGGASTIGRGRAMVVYVRDRRSPTGWFSAREITQEAPPSK
jgi:ketosteroid isomerase-like protein